MAAQAAVRPSSGRRPAQRTRPASAPARRVGQQPPPPSQHQQQPSSPGNQRPRPGSAAPRPYGGGARTRPGSSRGPARASSARPASSSTRAYPARPSSARTIAGATTPDQYRGWAGDARDALDRRAPSAVGRTSYFSNDRTGRWRGLGRAQWAWHNQHGHSALAVLQEQPVQRPWDQRPVTRVAPEAQHRARTDMDAIGDAFGRALLSGVDTIKEEGDNWQNATPSRMLGVAGVTERGWSQTGGTSAAKALRGRSTVITARRTMSELDKFERRLRGKSTDEFSPFPGLEVEPSFVDSSDEEDDVAPSPRQQKLEQEGVAADQVVSSRPPALRRGMQPGSMQREVRWLHRLHTAAVTIQRIARGWSTRRRFS
jgi:hypothetical protein